MRYSLYILLLLFILQSCERDASRVKVPDVKPFPVINCFISSEDTIIRAQVALSVPVFQKSNGQGYDVVKNATVKLTGPSGTFSMVYDATEELYLLDASLIKPQPGEQFFLSVAIPGFDEAHASTTMPSLPPALDKHQLDSQTQVAFGDTITTYKWKTTYTDFAGQVDFYRAEAAAWSLQMIVDYNAITRTFDTAYIEDFSGMYDETGQSYQSDYNADGKSKTNVFNLYGGGRGGKIIPTEFHIKLYRCSESYYRYGQTALLNQYGNDPFTEPTVVYNNFDKYFGCFGACQVKTTIIKK